MPDIRIDERSVLAELAELRHSLELFAGEYLNDAWPLGAKAAARVYLRDARKRIRIGPKKKEGNARVKHLRRSGRVISIRAGHRGHPDAAVAFGFYAPHAWLVEHGHGGPRAARGHPYLGPALRAKEGAAYNACLQAMRKEFPAVVRRVRRNARRSLDVVNTGTPPL